MRKFFIFSLIIGLIILLPWMLISLATTGMIYDEISKMPIRKYGLLLGTSPGSNGKNPFFLTRIEATKMLFEQGKIEYVVVS